MIAAKCRKALSGALAALLLLEGMSIAPQAQTPLAPDLHVVSITFDPSRPMFWAPVTAEVTVENAGGSYNEESAVSLEWCCGTLSRPLPPVAPGPTESVMVRFERALMFPEPGEYTFTATVDPAGLIPGELSGNNALSATLTVGLRTEGQGPPGPGEWFNESTALPCDDTDLMHIGRREPYAAQDLCPDEWGEADHEGCPAPDQDGDGQIEGPPWLDEDDCLALPGPEHFDGCPRPDRDRDRTADDADACPDDPGPTFLEGCQRPNADGDEVADSDDTCPSDPGPAEEQGCPVTGSTADPDGDGVGGDLCPNEWGRADCYRPGCPYADPSKDQDGDGVEDGADACPNAWGHHDRLGCPDPAVSADQDNDGVLDPPGGTDACPDAWGPSSNNGCPRPDTDGDGIHDDIDTTCPDQPGPGPTGCPAEPEQGDADGDGVRDDVLARPGDETCDLEDDEENDLGCQIYLRGQRESGCGVTSLAYTLRYFGKDCCGEPCHPDCLDEDIRMFRYVAMFTDPISIKRYAESKGLNAEIYVDGKIDDVRQHTERGIPVLLQIIADAGSNDVMSGHYVVPVAFCEVEQEFPTSASQTMITFYEPNGWQLSTTPERLLEFWGEVALPASPGVSPEFHLWNRLYIAVSDQWLPEGDTDEVKAQLAVARGVSNFMVGAQNFSDAFGEGEVERGLEGLVEMTGGLVTAILALISAGLSSGEDMPILGPIYGALGDIGADVAIMGQDVLNILGDLLNFENWADPLEMFLRIGDLLEAIGRGIVNILKDLWNFIVDGIGGFFKELACDWFDWGCPDTVVYYKHYASPDACMESIVSLNRMVRTQALGYVHTRQAPGTRPVYLYAESQSATQRDYHLCGDADWSNTDPLKVRLGVVGYSLTDPLSPTQSITLTTAVGAQIPTCATAGDLGHLLLRPQPETAPLWLMQSLDGGFIVSSDPCASTQTFVTPLVQGHSGEVTLLKGYTRELMVGLISASETEGAQKLYRFYDPGSEDCMLGTTLPTGGGFKREFENGDGLAVGDVNGDGKDEIVHASRDDWIQIFDMDGNPLAGFRLDFQNGDGLAVGNVNAGITDEIIQGDRDDRIRFLDMNGNLLGSFELNFDDGDRLAAGDVDGDGVDEIVHGDRSDKIRILKMDGSRLSVYDLDFQDGDGLAVGDVNGDGVDEIIHGDRGNKIRVLDTVGTRLSLFDLDFQSGDGLAAGDINGDGTDEIIHGDRDEWIRALTMDGTRVERFEIDFQSGDGLAAGDMDGDGTDEIVHADRDDYIRTNPRMEGYVNHGYLGYIYTDQQPGTVPLYQFYNPRFRDHAISIDPDPPAEELGDYTVREVLGYVFPPSGVEPERWTCSVSVYRFCKRVRKQVD